MAICGNRRSICVVVVGMAFLCYGDTRIQQFNYPSYCAPPNTSYLDPVLPANTQIPPTPYLPDVYQLRIEATIINKQTTWTMEEYYDGYDHHAAAVRIYRNNKMEYMLFDYKHAQLTYEAGGNCSVMQLKTDPFGNELMQNIKAGGIPHIYTTRSAIHFAKSSGIMYKGTKIVRGISCDWWQSCMFWSTTSSNFTLDFYVSVYNWTSPATFPQIPVLAEIQGTGSDGKSFHHVYEYYDFRTKIFDSDGVFDLPVCKKLDNTTSQECQSYCSNKQASTTVTPKYNITTQPSQTDQKANGSWCFKCEGMTNLQYCDRVVRCQSVNEVCYVQSYTRSLDVKLFRSGCMDTKQCSIGGGNVGCLQCCNGSFCNSEGCGDKGLQSLGQRGPLCFDCTHIGDPEACNTVQLCDSNQVCIIERYKWGDNNFHSIMGCTQSQVCTSKRSVSILSPRHAPVCTHCCRTDFCNMKCSSVNEGTAIIG